MILAIDTSLGTAVAVVDDEGVALARADSDDHRGHAEVIGDLIAQALADAGAGQDDVTHVAAGMGPGPFTGLRIGIAAARTFALARGVPVVPVPSHWAAALPLLAARDEPLAVVTDARRREVAVTVFRGFDDDGLPLVLSGPALLAKGPDVAIEDLVIEADADPIEVVAIDAAALGVIAQRALRAGRELTTSEPLYLRSPDVTLPHGPKRVGT